jgi:putative tryptophan/tyrosine transport system substrate-binding protein
MKRLTFITLIGGAAAWPLAARGQPAMPVVGYLNIGSAAARRGEVVEFQRGLNELGFVEDRNVSIEYHWADDQYDRLPNLAADLIRRPADVIVAPNGTATTLAAKALTTTVEVSIGPGVMSPAL